MHRILSPNHVQLVGACYPPSSALVTAGPDYKPNAQELSRLIYYASNRPGKLAKLSNELQKRAINDTRKAQYNQRARASLLVTLNIFKALISECRRDMSLLSTSLMSSLNTILTSIPSDLEVSAKVASVFVAWTTFTDGHIVGVDSIATKDYMAVLNRFASMCSAEGKNNDQEDRNRIRLVGLGALTGSITSNALYNSHNEFRTQATILVPALLYVLQQVSTAILDAQMEIIKQNPTPSSQYMSELRTRPTLERRAESIHIHVTGDKGPTTDDVANAALRALECLFSQSQGPQIGQLLRALLDCIEREEKWRNREQCCWFAQRAVEWIQFQYRFIVPTRILERLNSMQDEDFPLEIHRTLIAMTRVVLTAPTPLLNLSTSDVLFTLISLLLRRIMKNTEDSLLPDLVECIAALGTHIYYADQINDLASELISRMTVIENLGIPGSNSVEPDSGRQRSHALRHMLAALVGLMSVADRHSQLSSDPATDGKKDRIGSTPATVTDEASYSTSPKLESPKTGNGIPTLLRRSNIPVDVWQETFTLLCDGDLAVRSYYAQSLVMFLRQEVVKESISKIDNGDDQSSRTIRGLSVENQQKKGQANGDPLDRLDNIVSTRFLNTLHVAIYVLATSSALGMTLSRDPSPLQSTGSITEEVEGQSMIDINIVPSTPYITEEPSANTINVSSDASQQSQGSRRRSYNPGSQSKKSMMARFLKLTKYQFSSATDSSTASVAEAWDYRHILDIMTVTQEQLPCSALLSAIPMLIALDAKVSSDWSTADASTRGRLRATREVVLRIWLSIGKLWDCQITVDLAIEALSAYPSLLPESVLASNSLPDMETFYRRGGLPHVHENLPKLNIDVAISSLCSTRSVQLNTGMDEQTLRRQLMTIWSPETALRDPLEQSSHELSLRPDGMGHVLKLSPALMHIENLSLQSLTRSGRGVGVSDLRDALEGKGGLSSAALVTAAPSVSSFDHGDHSAISGDSRSSRPAWSTQGRKRLAGDSSAQARGVLDRLGIGAPNEPRNRKKSLPALQNRSPPRASRTSLLVPPYKT